jgi:hypothetical protein
VGNGGRSPPSEENSGEFSRALKDALPHLTARVREDYRHERELEILKLKMGWLGRLLGDEDHAPISFAVIVIIVCTVILVPLSLMVVAGTSHDSPTLDKIITLTGSIMTGAMGYVFGRISSSRRPQRIPKSPPRQ